MPESVEEYNEINSLRTDLNLNVNKNFFWVFFKISNPAKMNFPPTVVQVDGSPAPEWINDKTCKFESNVSTVMSLLIK